MSSLEELVVGTLAPAEEDPEPRFSPRSPLEIGSERASFEDLIELCRSFREEIRVSPSRAPELFVQLALYLENRPPTSHMFFWSDSISRLFACSLQPTGEALEELVEWSRRAEERLEAHVIEAEEAGLIPNTLAQIDYLGEFFGEDLPEELLFIGDVKAATVTRWISGKSSPSWSNRQRVRFLARIFYAASRNTEMSNGEIVDWYRQERGTGFSVRERVATYGGIIGSELNQILAEIGFRNL